MYGSVCWRPSTENSVSQSRRSLVADEACSAHIAVILILSASPALAQQEPAATAFPSAVASATTEAGPLLDGDVLGDPAWADVPAATGFVQTQPDEGQPATERTEVRVLFNDDTIYFGIVCYDRDPGRHHHVCRPA